LLVFIVDNIKSNLVANEVVIIITNKFCKQETRTLRQVEEELALANLVVVKVASLFMFVDGDE